MPPTEIVSRLALSAQWTSSATSSIGRSAHELSTRSTISSTTRYWMSPAARRPRSALAASRTPIAALRGSGDRRFRSQRRGDHTERAGALEGMCLAAEHGNSTSTRVIDDALHQAGLADAGFPLDHQRRRRSSPFVAERAAGAFVEDADRAAGARLHERPDERHPRALHPEIVAVVTEMIGRLDHLFSGMLSRPVIDLAETLAGLAPG